MYDDDYDDFDAEYEQYREDTGHITNLPEKEVAEYKKAITMYQKLNPSVILEVREGFNYPFGLYHTAGCGRDGGLSEFWAVKRTVELIGTDPIADIIFERFLYGSKA